MKQVNWTRILTILLVLLAGFAVLYILGSALVRFKHPLFIFTAGALVAYMLAPLVNGLERIVRARWAAILLSYVLLAGLLGSIGVLLFTPFIEQSQSLVNNLQTPSSSSLTAFLQARNHTDSIVTTLENQRFTYVKPGTPIPEGTRRTFHSDLTMLLTQLEAVRSGTVSRDSHLFHTAPVPKPKPGHSSPSPPAQTPIPPLYLTSIEKQVDVVATDYQASFAGVLLPPRSSAFAATIKAAKRLRTLSHQNYAVVRNTPILLLRAQTWLDEHGVPFDLHSKFGQAAAQISSQGSNLLNNAVTILQKFANALLNIALILIVAFYLLTDGRRLVRGGLNLVPAHFQEQVWYFVTSLDTVLGGYIRGQLFLSALAGIMGGAGAAVLGVPYPLLIGILTFVLEAVPVIGPMVAIFPAALISLFFMPLFTTILILAWNIIFQQIVTNILGPRVMGIAVGIHPLEAILAVLVGYPVGGFLGAFLAVPVMGILHIVIRELWAYFVHGHDLPTASTDDLMEPDDDSDRSGGTATREAPSLRPVPPPAPVDQPTGTRWAARLFGMLAIRRVDRADPKGKAT